MPSAWVLLAEGFEEIEAVTVIDVLRRAQVQVVTVGQVARSVCGSHGIRIVADTTMAEVGDPLPDALILPGGLPGSTNLRDDARVVGTVRRQAEQGRIVAAICAAPVVLEAAGVLTGRRATGYPGHDLPSAVYLEDRIVEDSNIITSRGPGTAVDFSMKLVERLIGSDTVAELQHRMLVA